MSPKLKLSITLALSTAIISGTNSFLAKIAVTAVHDPLVFTFIKNGLVAIFLLGLLLFTGHQSTIRQLNKSDIIKLLAIGIVGGSLPFILFFTGLSMIPAVTAAFIHKTLFIWVALLAIPLLGEKIGRLQYLALAILLGGNLVLFKIPSFSGNRGELMVLAATLLWAIENIIAKKALINLPSSLVAGARMILGSLIMLGIVIFSGKINLLVSLSPIQWSWTILTSILLTGYVLTWYTALKYAPATLVASLLVPATLVTNLLNAIFIYHTITNSQLLSGTLLAIGTVLLISRANQIASSTPLLPNQSASQPK